MQIDFSNPMVIVVLVAVVFALVLVVAFFVMSRKKASAKLRKQFGSEYDRAVVEYGSERKAEKSLDARTAQVEKLKLTELGSARRERFLAEWNAVQSRFLDHPKGALVEADELVSSLMVARGYPASSFEQSAEFVSVDHPKMIEDYRAAHAISARSGRGEASTEELRTAMIQYRSLFDELVSVSTPVMDAPVVEVPVTSVPVGLR